MSKVYEYVQQKIIDAIEVAIEEGGTVPWRKPWKNGVPRNYITKDPYRGINLLLLDGGSYLTYKQLQDLRKKDKNIKLRKGSKQHPVYFWKVVDKSSDESEEENGTYFCFGTTKSTAFLMLKESKKITLQMIMKHSRLAKI